MARIFFVDDDPITLQILGKAAQILGHTPILIDSGKTVTALAESNRPDLIMMDMMMPDMDGLSVLSYLHSQSQLADIPVVILSAGSAPDDRDRVLAAGAQAYLTKPVSLNILLETIKKFTAS
jgi:two-component system cell cycle response regulator DivK